MPSNRFFNCCVSIWVTDVASWTTEPVRGQRRPATVVPEEVLELKRVKNTRGRRWGPGKKSEWYEITRRKITCPQLLSQELGDNPAMSDKSTRVLMKSSKSLMRHKKNEKPKTAKALLHAEFLCLFASTFLHLPASDRKIHPNGRLSFKRINPRQSSANLPYGWRHINVFITGLQEPGAGAGRVWNK